MADSCTIVATKQIDDMLITEVDYDFGAGLVRVSIPHFQPLTKEDVTLGIQNRAVSEKRKAESVAAIVEIIKEFKAGDPIDVSAAVVDPVVVNP